MDDMPPGFELYEGQGKRGLDVMLTIHRKTVIVSKAARAMLGNPARVRWMIDREHGMIALRATDDDDSAGYALNTRAGYVACGQFFDWAEIDLPIGTKLHGEWYERDRAVAFVLPGKESR
jgi:hypothetical protein